MVQTMYIRFRSRYSNEQCVGEMGEVAKRRRRTTSEVENDEDGLCKVLLARRPVSLFQS